MCVNKQDHCPFADLHLPESSTCQRFFFNVLQLCNRPISVQQLCNRPRRPQGGDMRRSHVLVLIEFSLDEDNFFSALIGVWVTVTKNDWLRLRLLPRETFFFKNVFCQRNNSANMFGRAKMASSVLFCRAGVLCVFAFVFCE